MAQPAFLRRVSADERKAYRDLREALDADRHDLRWRHEVGSLVLKLVPVGEGREYGAARMQQLAGSLKDYRHAKGSPPERFESFLYKARELALAYPTQHDLANLKGLKWSQVRGLLAVTDPGAREKLLDRCRSEGWTAREVLAKVQAQRRRRGEQPLAARDIRSSLEGVALFSRRWIEEAGARLTACEVVVARLPASVQPEQIKSLVDDAVVSLDDITDAVRKMKRRLKDIAKRARSGRD